MSKITAQELDLLGCFGVEPQLVDPGYPWYYNQAVYEVEVDGLSVSFSIQPSCRDVRLVVHRATQRIYELNAVAVADVCIPDEPGRDIVELRLSEREWLRLQLRPSFEITQECRFNP